MCFFSTSGSCSRSFSFPFRVPLGFLLLQIYELLGLQVQHFSFKLQRFLLVCSLLRAAEMVTLACRCCRHPLLHFPRRPFPRSPSPVWPAAPLISGIPDPCKSPPHPRISSFLSFPGQQAHQLSVTSSEFKFLSLHIYPSWLVLSCLPLTHLSQPMLGLFLKGLRDGVMFVLLMLAPTGCSSLFFVQHTVCYPPNCARGLCQSLRAHRFQNP